MNFHQVGEIAPIVKGHESFFHGATLVTLLVGQSNGSATDINELEEDKLPDANEAFCRMLAYSKGELVGKTPFDFGAEEFRHFSRTNQGMTPFKEYRKFEGFLKSNNDGRIPILIHGSKLRDDSGKSIGNMAFITDLTEQKKALALAAEVQKSLLPQYGVNIPGGLNPMMTLPSVWQKSVIIDCGRCLPKIFLK